MKKTLFLLLCTAQIYGQTSTGQEQEFDYGIKNNSTQTITTPTYIGTFGTDGTQGKIPSAYIAKTAAVQDSLNKKLNLPTGFLQGLQLSINADPTKFNIAAGTYVVTDFTNLTQPVVKIINYAGATGLTPAYLATSNSTYIALDKNQNVISSASPFTDAQRRTLAIIGNVVHSNRTTINIVNEIKAPIVAVGNQLHDFMKAIGFLNESGNVYSANGANLQINKSVGDIFGMGINASDYLSPHKLTIPAQTALTFAYRFQNGTQLADTQNINPNIYDVGGTSTATPSNKWTIQRINLFQSGLSRIQPGQTVYNSFNDAVVALPTQPFVTEQNIADNAVFRCYLIVQQGTTNLASAVAGGTAQFVPVDKFGNIIGNGSVALTYSNIVAALGYTPENVANKSDSYTASSSTTYASTKAIVDGLATKQNTLTNPITGTGTINTIPKFTASGIIGNSNITDNGTIVSTSTDIKVNGLTIGKAGSGIVYNTSVGYMSLFSNTTGSYNSSFGYRTMAFNASGSNNTAFGFSSLENNTNGYSNSAIGGQAMQANTLGYNNSASGYQSMLNNTTGSLNTASGNSSGRYIADKTTPATILNNSIMFGYRTSPLADNQTNQVVIGYDATGLGSNSTVIGNSSTTTARMFGRQLINTSIDNGIDQLQVNGTISATEGTTANQVVVKSQLDEKVSLTGNETITGLKTFQGTAASDGGQLGSELTTTATGTNWTGTGFATGYTHTTGDVTPLVGTLSAITNNLYQITWTITGRTTGNVTINYGGIAISGIAASGNSGPKAISTATLNIVPTTDFNGTVVLSIKVISPSVATITFKNSSGAVTNEIRAHSSSSNFSIGLNAGKSNTTGVSNSAVGTSALLNNTTGNYNNAIGTSALLNNTTGNYNNAIGQDAGRSNTTGSGNNAIGASALLNNTTGNYNSAVGRSALLNNTTGNSNSAVGYASLLNNTTGNNNSAVGQNALINNTSGGSNSAIGSDAGRYIANKSTPATIVNNSVLIGYRTSPLADNQTNQVVIGYDAIGLGSNTTVIGNSSTTTARVYGRQLVNTSTDNGIDQLQVNGTVSATAGITANQVVVKSQLDGKVSLTGNETIAGVKSFSSGSIKLYDTSYGGYNTINTSVDAFNFKNTSNSNIFSVGNGIMDLYNSTGLFYASFSTIPLTADRTLTLPNASGTIALVETVKPYKVYTALLSQSGTSAPTATVLENTLGGSITWTYTSTGSYVGTLTSAFTLNKTWAIATGSGSADTTITLSRSSDNTVNVSTLLAGTPTNGIISPASIEIRVYN